MTAHFSCHQISDLSVEVAYLRDELQKEQVEQQTGSGETQMAAQAAGGGPPFDIDISNLARDEAENLLIEALMNRQFAKSLYLMQNLR